MDQEDRDDGAMGMKTSLETVSRLFFQLTSMAGFTLRISLTSFSFPLLYPSRIFLHRQQRNKKEEGKEKKRRKNKWKKNE